MNLRARRTLRFAPIGLFALLAVSTAGAIERPFDPRHSVADFAVRVLWLHQIRGHIGAVDGTLQIDAHDRAQVDAWIDVSMVRMDDARYLDTVRSPDFFDSADYPRMHFRSEAFDASLLAAGGLLSGRLTLRGITRPVQFELQPGACVEPRRGPCTIRVRGGVRRSDYGMRAHRFSVADHVQLRLRVVLDAVEAP